MKSLFFLWGALVLLAVLVQTTQADSAPTVKVPNNGFWNTDVRLCGIDSQGNCHTKTYSESVARFGIAGALMAGFTFLFLLFFVPARFICNACGGQNASYGMCPDRIDKRQYTRREIIYVKIAALVVVLPMLIAIALGFASNTDISGSIHNITTTISNSGNQIYTDLVNIQTAVEALTSDPTVTRVLDDAVSTAKQVQSDLLNAKSVAYKYDTSRKSLTIVGFALCLVLILLGIAAVVFNLRVLALVLSLVGFLILIIVWLSFGLHLVADKFVYDVCVDIDLLTSGSTEANTTSVFKEGALAKLWKCDNNTDFQTLESVINQEIAISTGYVCQVRDSFCFNGTAGDPNWQCLFSPSCSADTLNTVTDSTHTRITDGTSVRSLQDCAVNCQNGNYKNASMGIVEFVNDYNNFTTIYNSMILPVVQCQVAEGAFEAVQTPLCIDLFDSVYGVAVSCLVLGIFFMPFIALMVIGFKRFQSFSEGII